MEITTTDSRIVYSNRWMRVREDHIQRADGSPGLYGVVDKPDFSLVVPVDATGFHIVEQYRYPVGARYWEFPQGMAADGRIGDAATLAAYNLLMLDRGLALGAEHFATR